MKCTRTIKISCLHSRCRFVKLNRKGSVKMQVPTMCFSFFLSIILSYRVNVTCNNKRRKCFLNFFNKNSSAICARFIDQCTTKDEKKKRERGTRETYASKGKEMNEITHTTRRLFISSEIGMCIQNMVMEYACTRIPSRG